MSWYVVETEAGWRITKHRPRHSGYEGPFETKREAQFFIEQNLGGSLHFENPMARGTKRLLVGGGVAAAVLLLFGGIAMASTKKGGTYRNATAADVARDGVQAHMQALLAQQVGYTETGTFNGNDWKFVVCSAGGCDPPSSSPKDVRGYVAA
jgi:hypothetical protein